LHANRRVEQIAHAVEGEIEVAVGVDAMDIGGEILRSDRNLDAGPGQQLRMKSPAR
jgi:hypothetical protein